MRVDGHGNGDEGTAVILLLHHDYFCNVVAKQEDVIEDDLVPVEGEYDLHSHEGHEGHYILVHQHTSEEPL